MTTTTGANLAHLGDSLPAPRVLIVGNMLYQIGMLRRLLDAMGCESTLAIREDIGLANLATVNYDVMILDVDLGDPVVRDVALHLRQEHPDMHLALLIGWWDQREAELRNYCDSLIYKPVHPQQLQEALRSRATRRTVTTWLSPEPASLQYPRPYIPQDRR